MPKYIEPKEAYDLGKKYKKQHSFRTSPYYENPVADKYFFAGFDGFPLESVSEGNKELKDVQSTHRTSDNCTNDNENLTTFSSTDNI